MKIIKLIENDDGFTMDSSAYSDYVNGIRELLSGDALQFMIADWHYDHLDPRCPHDARIDYLKVDEKDGAIDIELLLNRAIEGSLRLKYGNVQWYVFDKQKTDWPVGTASHGDWMIDEMLLCEDGFLTHEIILSESSLKIKHKSFEYWLE
ncbi:hypothetical protein [Caballeronia sp. SL2Y3]|uniref:hypothetical protein n=1 Tax=Caballeronia sp. SL2Y3 TaxID=2878151 RepID=UPI001FD4985B|nr:hypothetical protein [Caballeronia sp. SL2Y3]